MTAQEQWQAWREAEGAVVSIDEYLSWIRDLTRAEGDDDKVFEGWRLYSGGESALRRALNGEIVSVGCHNQILFGMFYSLYQVLNGRQSFLVVSQQAPTAYLLMLNRSLSRLGKLNIRCMGAMLLSGRVYLGDCQGVDIAIVDYCELMGALRRNGEQFKRIVKSVFFVEMDVALFDTRLVILERGVERGAGLLYKNPQELPEGWKGNAGQIDAPVELGQMEGLRMGGCYSYTDPYTAKELTGLLGPSAKPFKAVQSPVGYAAFAYGTNQARASALVQDVMQTEGNALIVYCTSAVKELLCTELRKSGQSYTPSLNTSDALTFFSPSSGESGQKKVMLMRGNPSTLIMPDKPLCRGALYIAEHFVAGNMHEKALAMAEGVFEQVHKPRLYFSLSDDLFVMHDTEGSFQRMFSLMEFTEKYDPWRQIRRVLAKCMMRKLHALRVSGAATVRPMITMMLDGKGVGRQAVAEQPKPSRLSKLDAPCFCGSGKPFRECHGKQAKH